MMRLKNKTLSKAIQYIALTFFSLLVILPFSVIVFTSLKSKADALKVPFTVIGASGIDWQGYGAVFEYGLLGQGIANTMITSLAPTFVCLFVSAVAAFAYAKIDFPGKTAMFNVLIFTMMIPGTILLVPHYMLYSWLGWTQIGSYANFLPLIVPQLFGGVSIIFFLRQFLYSIPDSLIEAGKLDGLSWPGVFVRIVAPLMAPALIAQGLMHFIGQYNAYLGPMLYLKTDNMYTLQLIVATFKDYIGKNYPAQMACSLLTMLPILVLYIVFQKYFVEGISTSGMKL
ncbi:MAG: carbohydrate ABC transporter permease [Candidatus Scatosoma sp.]